MLLTLAVSSLRSLLSAKGSLTLLSTPDFVMKELGLRGMNIPSSMLAGWSLRDLDGLRDAADKAGCPCLVLVDDSPICFVGSPKQQAAARDRVANLAAAANRLGCNAISVLVEAGHTNDDLELSAQGLKQAMGQIERFETNLLIAPYQGLTENAASLTELIKRIGGFRIGSLPSFEQANASGDLQGALRKLAPYAGAMHASVRGFDKAGKHRDYDLVACVEAVLSVGYVNTLAIEYIGNGDPIGSIEQARSILDQAIEAVAGS